MQGPPTPDNEAARLASLRSTGLLDSSPSETWDRLTRQTAQLLGVPTVLISLIDTDRQWFLSRFGFDICETPREVAFCAHVVAADLPLVVADTTLDLRFRSHPLVLDKPEIRAYLGVPIHSPDGHCLGTLCAIDWRPRSFGPKEVDAMKKMASLVEQILARRALAAST